ncbi:MotA/TolQ/ExbB proton channel family protein [Serratia microhaemolytica]|uniref:MotA/TolQ/ExbB proton channel family protein n=1 Tax=Serratia microhaemolytica TaxID=2675110 RepID=UPI000FDEEF6C|nr:MotA/TolQ/ExbB proton channel family protein [Serratia microhaemolytica]
MSFNEFFLNIYSQLGMMRWPLTLLSLLMLTLIVERLLFFSLHHSGSAKAARGILSLRNWQDEHYLLNYLQQYHPHRHPLINGICLLISYRQVDKTLREEAVNLWLEKKRRQFFSGSQLLQLIGVLAPLLGLLGTVLGLIEMFDRLSVSQSAVTPGQLAAGLGLAMATTAAGLLIALPAIASAQLFSLWAQHQLDVLASHLNQFNLSLAGLPSEQAAQHQGSRSIPHCDPCTPGTQP